MSEAKEGKVKIIIISQTVVQGKTARVGDKFDVNKSDGNLLVASKKALPYGSDEEVQKADAYLAKKAKADAEKKAPAKPAK